jgi:predicted secreted Zn-dependent protease
MIVNVDWGPRNTSATYKIKAKSAKEALNELNSRVIDGEVEWGNFKGFFTTSEGKIFVDGSGNVSRIRLTPTYTITLPNWPNLKSQSPSIKEKWTSMLKFLRIHENGHLTIYIRYFNILKIKLEEMEEVKQKDVQFLLDNTVSEGQKEQDKYDLETDHGKNQNIEFSP